MEYCPLAQERCQGDECMLARKDGCLMKDALEKYTKAPTLEDLRYMEDWDKGVVEDE